MAWGKKECWYKVDVVGDEQSSMELDIDSCGQTTPAQSPLAESESIRHIKEEWTRLQVAADGLKTQLLRGTAETGDREEQQDVFLQGPETKRGMAVSWHNVRTLPRSRVPFLNSLRTFDSTFPSPSTIRSSLRKNVFETRSLESDLDMDMEVKDVERPQGVVLKQTAFIFGADTPTQTDIRWAPPPNAQLFRLLSYDIEVDGGQGWNSLAESHLPILRVYFTSDKIILGRFSRAQETEPVGVRLRIRATGSVKKQTGEETVKGSWSEEIWLTLEGSQVTYNTAV